MEKTPFFVYNPRKRLESPIHRRSTAPNSGPLKKVPGTTGFPLTAYQRARLQYLQRAFPDAPTRELLRIVLQHRALPADLCAHTNHSREFHSFPDPKLFNKLTHREIPAMRPIEIKHVTFINGVEATTLSDDHLYALIAQNEAEIAKLEALKNRPRRIQDKLTALQTGIDALVALVDKA